jgi:hypothetical protein
MMALLWQRYFERAQRKAKQACALVIGCVEFINIPFRAIQMALIAQLKSRVVLCGPGSLREGFLA